MFFLPAKHRFCITLHKKLKNLNCIKHLQDPIDLHVFRQHQICNMNIAAVAQWLEHSPREQEVVGSIPVIPKTLKMVPDASLLGAQHIRTGLAPLSSQTSLKKRDGYHPE